MVRAIRIHAVGGPEVLRLDDVPVGEPGPGEALVEQTALGVNFIDIYQRSGLYPLPRLPHGLGQEAAGVVRAVGPGVTEVQVGDRVGYAGGTPGAYAEARVVPAARLVALPSDLDDVTAAAVLLKGMTVEYLVRRVIPLRPGDTVLWHAAAGGVGLLACQWLADAGVRVIGTVSSDEKAALARAHGATHAIVYTREDFVAKVKELTNGRGVPAVFDSVGKTTFLGSLDCLAPRGTMVSFGNASGKPAPLDPLVLSQKGSLFLTRPTLGHYTATRAELLESGRELFDRLRRGVLRVSVTRMRLADAEVAHRALEGRGTTGSIVLLP